MGVKAVSDDDEIMMITTEWVIIQIRMDELRDLGRITSGVRLIRLDEGAKVAQIAKVRSGEIPGEEEDSSSEDTASEDNFSEDTEAEEEFSEDDFSEEEKDSSDQDEN